MTDTKTRGGNLTVYASGDIHDRKDAYMKRNNITSNNAFLKHCIIEELDRDEKKASKKKK